MEPVARSELIALGRSAESTATVAERVRAARERAAARFADTPWQSNSEVPGHELRTRWPVCPGALNQVERDLECGLLTARGLDRVLRVAWTAADLAGRDRPTKEDVNWALELRTGVRRGAFTTQTGTTARAGTGGGARASTVAGARLRGDADAQSTAGTERAPDAETEGQPEARAEPETTGAGANAMRTGAERPATAVPRTGQPLRTAKGERRKKTRDHRPRIALVRQVVDGEDER